MKNDNQTENSLATKQGISRRTFIANTGKLVALTAAGPLVHWAPLHTTNQPANNPINGIQIGAVSFVDEGVEKVLEILQKRAAVNTIFLTTFTYGRGLAGRQIPGQPFPDHGSQQSDEKTFHGGNYATPHPQFYRNTVLKETRAPEHGNLDIVATVLPAAKKQGLRVFCSVEDVFRSDVLGINEVAEVDLQGQKKSTLYLFNPNVRAFWTALVTDLCTSYDIDGILFFNERNGPLLNAVGASHAQNIASAQVTCFCEHHQRAARERGIDFQRARLGYQ
ncbi:MAG: hypothetical protein ICV51_14265, partial [Flavisolibacter sp.]|nr:hypothetical protein [Flavisolibacter sp.]